MMGRPRAGNSWCWINHNGRSIHLIQDEAGRWITTGHAKDWPRCNRCRRPHKLSPFDSGLCDICYFYSTISTDEFWRLHNAGYALAPYNIGRACMENHELLVRLNEHPERWRSLLKSQWQ
jgi:hypothetical protein